MADITYTARVTDASGQSVIRTVTATVVVAPTGITHGDQLIPQGQSGCNVGPTVLLGASGYPGNLQVMSTPSRGYWRTDTPDEFSLSAPYALNNLISNKGGVVPSGGMIIDGYQVPAGTRVVQFRDFSSGDFWTVSGTSFLFRGCRFRSQQAAPGFFNTGAGNTGKLYLFFSDMGGVNAAAASEVPIKIYNGPGPIIYRNYITYVSTGIQINVSGAEVVENYVSKLTLRVATWHLNGFTMNGGENSVLILRNNITGPTPDESGHQIGQTDCISLFQDFGSFSGSGTNRDGTKGYQIKDNFIGGTGYCVYAGLNAGKPASSVNNVVLTGNKITTQWYSRGGNFGAVTAEPSWGSQGNVKSNNTFVPGGGTW